MIYSDHSTRHTDAGQCQCFLEAKEKMLNAEEKVSHFSIFLYYIIIFHNTIISVIMPPSALDILTRLNINYPMLFRLTNKRSNRQTHCGVLEFIADEEKIYIPYWV